MNLLEAIKLLCEANLHEANDWYQWREINESKIPGNITLPNGNQYHRNIALKNELHKAWMLESEPKKKGEFIKYYITVWGGIRTNAGNSLDIYMNSSPESLISYGQKGIASWSKALVIHNPNKYAIFDARVSLSLNCLQIINKVDKKELFPVLSSRNKTIKEGNRIIKLIAFNEAWDQANSTSFYNEYLSLLQNVANCRGTNISTIEMLLFTKALAFAKEIRSFA